MTTPLTITSLNQGKIYKDWTLTVVDDTPAPAKTSIIARLTSAISHFASVLRVSIDTRFSIPHHN